MIPQQLKNENIKFCKIKKGTKKPFEKNWTNKPYSYEEMEEWLNKNDENYGVLCGYGDLAIIDSDNPSFQVAIENMLPKTYRIKTGSGGTHNYFFIPELKQKIICNLDDEQQTHLGEVQSWGTQCVAPNSIHPSGNKYEEINQNDITTISCEILLEVLKPFMEKEMKETEENAFYEIKQNSDVDNISVSDVWGITGLKKQGTEYYGHHPIHDSTGGMNFWINPLKNTWHCFRCNSGGGVLSAIAVKHGLIDCSEARKGNLRGEKALQSIKIAEEKYGLKDIKYDKKFKNEQGLYVKVPTNVVEVKEKIKIIWEKDLKNYEEENKGWIIDKLIPTKSVCILTGKRGTMKTFISLLMSYSISNGEDFLNFQTEKGKVIYLDKENGIGIMKQRTSMMKNGLKTKDDFNIGFICYSQLKVDNLKSIELIEEMIKEEKPSLIIIDTYRRSVSFDENDAGEVSKLFVDILRPLIEKYNFSILLIHHNRKGTTNHKEDSEIDEMDELRGSSDLSNYADAILKLERKGNKSLLLKQLKNRNALEEKPIKIDFEFSENLVKFWNGGEFIPQSNAERCAEMLILWLTTEKIKHFKTKEAKDMAFKKGVKETNFKISMENLQERGLIERTTKGEYDVKI
jgi:RecA-family ATPase